MVEEAPEPVDNDQADDELAQDADDEAAERRAAVGRKLASLWGDSLPKLPSALMAVQWASENFNYVEMLASQFSNALGPYSVMQSQINAVVSQAAKSLGPYSVMQSQINTVASQFAGIIQESWGPIFASIGRITDYIYPENLRALDPPPSIAVLQSVLLDEGIPLMWVPGSEIAGALLAASGPGERRAILRRRWRGIVTDCEMVIDTVNHPELDHARDMAFDCVDAMRDGHRTAAQALATNLLDTLMNRHLDKTTRRTYTSNWFAKNGIKFDMESQTVRVAFTFAPVWCAHAHYKPEEKDPIPRTFVRHASAHSVSREQYSLPNAVTGLMLVTSVLRFFDLELRKTARG